MNQFGPPMTLGNMRALGVLRLQHLIFNNFFAFRKF
jgi:hypothetical protein